MANYPPITIGRPKHAILEAVARFHYLSAPQVTRLLFSMNSLKYVREHLKELFQAEYLERLYVPAANVYGSPLAVYCLARKGIAYVRKHHVAPAGRFNPSEQAEREWMFLKHTLEANDLVIALHRLQRVDPASELVRFISERELKRTPGVTLVKGRKTSVIFDGWVHLQRHWPKRVAQHYIAFELDRGTIEQTAFRRKIRNLAAFVDNGYESRFGVAGLTIAFVTTHSPKRLGDMIRWTEAELGNDDLAELFLFAHCDPATIDPLVLVSHGIWSQPFAKQTTSLLEPPA